MSITKVWACTAYPMRCRFLPFWIQSNICKWLFSATNGDKIISNLIHTANISNIKITIFFFVQFSVFCLVLLQVQNYFGHMSKLFWKYPIIFGQVQTLWTGAKTTFQSKISHFEPCPKRLNMFKTIVKYCPIHCLDLTTQPKEPESFLAIYATNCHHMN